MTFEERIPSLVELRRRYRDIPSASTGYLAAEELAEKRSSFGDWCWLAWYHCQRLQWFAAQTAIKKALSLKPDHLQARDLAAQIESELTSAIERNRREMEPSLRQYVKDEIIRQDLENYYRTHPRKPQYSESALIPKAEGTLVDFP